MGDTTMHKIVATKNVKAVQRLIDHNFVKMDLFWEKNNVSGIHMWFCVFSMQNKKLNIQKDGSNNCIGSIAESMWTNDFSFN